jgi:hypothetical protein
MAAHFRRGSTALGLTFCFLFCAIAFASSTIDPSLVINVRNVFDAPVNVTALINGSKTVLASGLEPLQVSGFVVIYLPNGSSSTGFTLNAAFLNSNVSVDFPATTVTPGTFQVVLAWDGGEAGYVMVAHDNYGEPDTDEALVRVAAFPSVLNGTEFQGNPTECFQCLFLRLWRQKSPTPYFVVNSDYPFLFQLLSSRNSSLPLAERTVALVSRGQYTLVLHNNSFSIYADSVDSTDFWLPLVIAAAVYIALAVSAAVLFRWVLRLSVFDPCLREKPQPLLSEDEIQVRTQSAV